MLTRLRNQSARAWDRITKNGRELLERTVGWTLATPMLLTGGAPILADSANLWTWMASLGIPQGATTEVITITTMLTSAAIMGRWGMRTGRAAVKQCAEWWDGRPAKRDAIPMALGATFSLLMAGSTAIGFTIALGNALPTPIIMGWAISATATTVLAGTMAAPKAWEAILDMAGTDAKTHERAWQRFEEDQPWMEEGNHLPEDHVLMRLLQNERRERETETKNWMVRAIEAENRARQAEARAKRAEAEHANKPTEITAKQERTGEEPNQETREALRQAHAETREQKLNAARERARADRAEAENEWLREALAEHASYEARRPQNGPKRKP